MVSAFSDFLRAFSEPILQASLSDQPDTHALIGAVYERVPAALTANPANYEFHYIQVAAFLTRRTSVPQAELCPGPSRDPGLLM